MPIRSCLTSVSHLNLWSWVQREILCLVFDNKELKVTKRSTCKWICASIDDFTSKEGISSIKWLINYINETSWIGVIKFEIHKLYGRISLIQYLTTMLLLFVHWFWWDHNSLTEIEYYKNIRTKCSIDICTKSYFDHIIIILVTLLTKVNFKIRT